MPTLSIAVDKESWDREFITLPPGQYEGVMEPATEQTSKEKGTKGLKLVTRIESPQVATVNGVEKKILGQKIFDDLWLTAKGAGFIKKTLTGCGIAFTLDGGAVVFNSDDFTGKRVRVSVGVEEMLDATRQPTGKKRNTVEGYQLV